MTIRKYKKQCEAIFDIAEQLGVRYQSIMNEFIMMIEKYVTIDNWNRDEFLEEMIRVKIKMKGGRKK